MRSYLCLTVTTLLSAHEVTTTLDWDIALGHVPTSLHLPMPRAPDDGLAPLVSVTLYAGNPGAFIDLAADLAWLTGRALADFVLDRHLILVRAPDATGALVVAALIHQAVGVLICHGYTRSTPIANSMLEPSDLARTVTPARDT